MMMIRVHDWSCVLLAAAIAATACSSPSDSDLESSQVVVGRDGQGGSELLLAVGNEVTAPGTDLRVRFDGVQHDSRCPIDAVCITAGDAEVVISLGVGSGQRTRHVLHWSSGFDRPGSAVAGSYRVSLVVLDPMPRSTSGPVAQSAYRVRLKVERV